MQTSVKNALLSVMAAAGACVLAACVTVPKELQGEFAALSPAGVQPDQIGSSVRWGGVLVDTRNEKDRTCFEVVSRALDSSMRPRDEDSTTGRFIACTAGFHDPQVYAEGREVTVTGQIQGLETRKIEEFDYRYPVLEITDLVLWDERPDVVVYDRFYDPFYYPYYWGHPYYWGYYPYFRHPWPYYYGPRTAEPRSVPHQNQSASEGKRGH